MVNSSKINYSNDENLDSSNLKELKLFFKEIKEMNSQYEIFKSKNKDIKNKNSKFSNYFLETKKAENNTSKYEHIESNKLHKEQTKQVS